MVDRPTANRPVQLRSIETFGDYQIYRPNAYDQRQSLAVPSGGETPRAPVVAAGEPRNDGLGAQALAALRSYEEKQGASADPERQQRLAAALAAEASRSGIASIHEVTGNTAAPGRSAGSTLFAVERGASGDMPRYVGIDVATALSAPAQEARERQLAGTAQAALQPAAADEAERQTARRSLA